MTHEALLIRRDAIIRILQLEGVGFKVARERANNIAAALQDGVAPVYNVAFEMLQLTIPESSRRYWVAKNIESAWKEP